MEVGVTKRKDYTNHCKLSVIELSDSIAKVRSQHFDDSIIPVGMAYNMRELVACLSDSQVMALLSYLSVEVESRVVGVAAATESVQRRRKRVDELKQFLNKS